MFQGLRQNAPFYILSKSEQKIDIGEVVSVTNPTPQYPTTYNSGVFQPPLNVVDVVVKIGDEQVTFQNLRADLSIADTQNGMVVVSDNRDAMIGEIESYQKLAQKKLEEVPIQQHIVEACSGMLATLSPELKREAEQTAEIEGIKKEVAGINSRFDKLEGMLAKALGRGSSKGD